MPQSEETLKGMQASGSGTVSNRAAIRDLFFIYASLSKRMVCAACAQIPYAYSPPFAPVCQWGWAIFRMIDTAAMIRAI